MYGVESRPCFLLSLCFHLNEAYDTIRFWFPGVLSDSSYGQRIPNLTPERGHNIRKSSRAPSILSHPYMLELYLQSYATSLFQNTLLLDKIQVMHCLCIHSDHLQAVSQNPGFLCHNPVSLILHWLKKSPIPSSHRASSLISWVPIS